jgi:hypothetical protein
MTFLKETIGNVNGCAWRKKFRPRKRMRIKTHLLTGKSPRETVTRWKIPGNWRKIGILIRNKCGHEVMSLNKASRGSKVEKILKKFLNQNKTSHGFYFDL